VLTEIVLQTDDEAVPGALLARIDSSPAKAEGKEAKPSNKRIEEALSTAPGPRPSPGNEIA
jgi:pyruvate/2-oxoglutarate dehydrogenase complex dihydrolipoamide acyltransferase (E2) component